jgi:glutathione S-transferase
MKLRYSPASPYVRKVIIVALEGGLAERIEKVPTAAVPVKANEALQAENPLVKLPSLTTDTGETLYDSPVICEYLDSLHSSARLFPAAGPARWTALRRQALGDGILDAAILIRYETTVRPKELQWADWVDGQMRKVRGALDALEGERLGGAFDIGTLTIGCALGYLDFRFPSEDWRKTRPKLAAWFGEISRRPSMKATEPQG